MAAAALASSVHAAEFHVAISGNDANSGNPEAPFRTIQHAAGLAQPGDVITVHAGVYRERIDPPRGGESDVKRIVYQAAPGEAVEIKGSEVAGNWVKVQEDVWKTELPGSFFGSFNPYGDLIHGDWFNGKGRPHHTGAVYLNGEWLIEAAKLADVLQPAGTVSRWFGKVEGEKTTIWAQFKKVDPNHERVEINVRRAVFYPSKTGINFITVRGFTLRDAATPWAPPTAEQVGLIGTHWSKGWIIESNTISHSTCSGIALGKYGDEWDNRAESAEGYTATLRRALTNGWNKETVGSHLVRYNDISHCEQSGIVGSLGAAFSVIQNNTIHEIHVRQLFSGAEMAGIKFHGGIDVRIQGNHIYRCCGGLWLDWMGQGARVSQNLFNDNISYDLFFEVDHGPILVDNNIFLSACSVNSRSRGVAFVHDWFGGTVNANDYDGRVTPFHQPHSTALAGSHDNPRGDDRYYNNIFAQHANLTQYDSTPGAVMGGNIFLKGARSSKIEALPAVQPEFDPAAKLVRETDDFYLTLKFDPAWLAHPTKTVTTALLGRAAIPNEAFEQPDGSPIVINTDYFSRPRNESNPTPGPFQNPGQGDVKLKVW
jgi:alpha-N-arabinofuranosidase